MDDLDHALAELPRHDAPDWAIQQILRQVEEDRVAEEPTAPPRRSSPPGWVWVAVAAGLLVAAGVLVTRSAPEVAPGPVANPGITLKGATAGPTEPSISLGLSLLRNDVPVALVPGAQAKSSDTVLLRYTTDSEGFAYLFRRGPDGSLEVFHGTATLPGTHHVTIDGRIVGYELDGLDGEHLFGVAFSRDPWAPGDGDAARAPAGLADALGTGTFPQTVGAVRVDALPVRLEPGPK